MVCFVHVRRGTSTSTGSTAHGAGEKDKSKDDKIIEKKKKTRGGQRPKKGKKDKTTGLCART